MVDEAYLCAHFASEAAPAKPALPKQFADAARSLIFVAPRSPGSKKPDACAKDRLCGFAKSCAPSCA